MRLLDQEKGIVINDLLVLLTLEESCELRDELNRLISKKTKNNHSHVSNIEFTKEITISIYDFNKLDGFSERVKKLIVEDK